MIQPGTSGAWIRAEYTEGKPVYWSWWGVVADGARTAATGTISLPTNPTNGQVITFNGGSTTTVTAVTSGATGNQFNIGGSAAASFTNLMALLDKSTDSNISQVLGLQLHQAPRPQPVTYFIPGTTGNSFAMTTNITGGSVSATLSGGTTTGTDNTQAIINWSIWANYVFTTIGGHTVIAPPGEIHWNVSSGTAVAAFFNLGKFNWIANNVKFVNISASQMQPGPAFQAQHLQQRQHVSVRLHRHHGNRRYRRDNTVTKSGQCGELSSRIEGSSSELVHAFLWLSRRPGEFRVA